jgi:riboflavin kinase/FMN adenylyltransferase
VRVAETAAELAAVPRAVALGTFDGVHVGHQAVVRAAVEVGAAGADPAGSAHGRGAGGGGGAMPTVLTFHPHPREVLGNRVELLATLERRLELLAALGVAETLVVPFTPALAELSPERFADSYLRAIGAEVVVADEAFRFGRRRAGDPALLERLGFRTTVVPHVPGVSSTEIRRLLGEGDLAGAARMLGRPPEVEGVVVAGDARGGTLGFPTANLRVEQGLLVPRFGIYAGEARGHRAAVSIGVNPHYGGSERRVEAFLLDFEGDLYGERLVVSLWQRLRDEAAFASEAELVAQIERDVAAARAAGPPA